MSKIVRASGLFVVLAAIVAGFLYRSQFNPVMVRSFITQSGFAPGAFVLLQIAASLLFVPRTMLGIAAGLVFGFAWGMVWAVIGALLGAIAGFALVRWLNLAVLLDQTTRIEKLMARAEQGGWRAVAIIRLTPIPHSVVNTALALTKVRWRDYLSGSLVGMLPMTVAQVDIGAAGNMAFEDQRNWIVVCLVLAAGLASSYFIKRINPSR